MRSFWHTLQFVILKFGHIGKAAMLLQNFIIKIEVGHIMKAAVLLHNFAVNECEEKGWKEGDAAFFNEFSLKIFWRDQD